MHHTNAPDLYQSLDLDPNRHALYWTNDHRFHQDLAESAIWSRFEKIYVVGWEGFGYRLLKETKQSNLYVWDMVIDQMPNYNLYLDHWDRVQQIDQDLGLTSKLQVDKKRKIYRFDALMGKKRPHRDLLWSLIAKHTARQEFLVSYRPIDAGWIAGSDQDTSDQLQKIGYDIRNVRSDEYQKSLTTPTQRDYVLSQLLPYKIFNQAWYSLITETYTDIPFGSEKLAKALLGQRLFVFFGGHGVLQTLRGLGFATFDHVIDENYDAIKDPQERWSLAWRQVEVLLDRDPADIIDRCADRLMHNCQWFKKIMPLYQINGVMQQIRDHAHS